MAIEDAVVFGTLFANLTSWEQINTFTNAYQEIREGRTTEVNKNEASAAAFCRLPPGPAKEARDAEMRLSRDEWDDGSMKKEFEGIAGLFGYEAEDAAQARDCSLSAVRTYLRFHPTGVVGNMGPIRTSRTRIRELRFRNVFDDERHGEPESRRVNIRHATYAQLPSPRSDHPMPLLCICSIFRLSSIPHMVNIYHHSNPIPSPLR